MAKNWNELTDRERATINLQASFSEQVLPPELHLTEADDEARYGLLEMLLDEAVYGDTDSNFEDALKVYMVDQTLAITRLFIDPMMDRLETAHQQAERLGADNPHAVATELYGAITNQIVQTFTSNFIPKLAATLMGYMQRGGFESLSHLTHRLESTFESISNITAKIENDFRTGGVDSGIKCAVSALGVRSMLLQDFNGNTRTTQSQQELIEKAIADERALKALAIELGIAEHEAETAETAETA